MFSTDFLGSTNMVNAAQTTGVRPEHFDGVGEYDRAMRQTRFWIQDCHPAGSAANYYNRVIKAAPTLQGLLGKQGVCAHQQAQALGVLETHWTGMTLAFNDHLLAGMSMESYLEQQAGKRRDDGIDDVFFDSSNEAQADWEQAKATGLWTLIDGFSSRNLAASSTLPGVLRKGWAAASSLEPLRRQSALDQGLPAVAPHGPFKPRF